MQAGGGDVNAPYFLRDRDLLLAAEEPHVSLGEGDYLPCTIACPSSLLQNSFNRSKSFQFIYFCPVVLTFFCCLLSRKRCRLEE